MTNPMQASDPYCILHLRMGNVWSDSIGDSTVFYEEGVEEALMEMENEYGPLWPLYSEYWPGRLVRKDGRTGHVRTPPYRDPASGLQLVCNVLWDDQPHRSDDVAVSVLRSHLLPAFVEDPNLVPAKILQLQRQNWTHEGLLLHLQLGHAQAQENRPGAPAVTTDEAQAGPSQNANGNDKGVPNSRDPRNRSRLRSQQQRDAVAKQTSAAVSVQENSVQKQPQQPAASGRSSRLAKKVTAEEQQQQQPEQDAVVSPLSEIHVADTEPQAEYLEEAVATADAATDIVAGITADVLREVRTAGADRTSSPAVTPSKAATTPNNNGTFVSRLIGAFVRPSPQAQQQQQQQQGLDGVTAPAGRPSALDIQNNGKAAPLRSPMAPPAPGPFSNLPQGGDAQQADKSPGPAAEGRRTRAASNVMPLTPGESATLAARVLVTMHQDTSQHELGDADEGPDTRAVPRKRGDGKPAAETDKQKLKRKAAELAESDNLTPQPSADTSKRSADDSRRAQTDAKKQKKQRASSHVAPLSTSRVTLDVDMGVERLDRRSLLLSHAMQKISRAVTPTASPAASGQRPTGKENKATGKVKGAETEQPVSGTADGAKGGRQYTTRSSPKQPMNTVNTAFFSPQNAQPDYSDKKLWLKGWTGIYYPTNIARRSTDHPYDYAGDDDENPDFYYEDFMDFYVDDQGKEWVLIKWRDWQLDVGQGPLPPKRDGEGQGHWERVEKALGVNDKRAWKDWKSGKSMPMWYKKQLANHIQPQIAKLANTHAITQTEEGGKHR